MDQKIPVLTSPNFDSSLKARLIDQVIDSFGNDGYFDRASSRAVPSSVNAAKYEAALNSLAGELARVKENERQKIAEQLHDGLGQDLLLAKMRLGMLSDSLPPGYHHCVAGIADIIGDLIRRTRTVMQELSSQILCETGLKSALQSLAQEIQSKHEITCSAKLDLMPKLLTDEVQQVLFRAVRELLFNVVKHARASRVKIVVERKPGSVAIEVGDNGRGFDCHKAPLSDLSIGRFGLFSVRADLARIGSDLRIVSRAGKGTRAIITLPLHDA